MYGGRDVRGREKKKRGARKPEHGPVQKVPSGIEKDTSVGGTGKKKKTWKNFGVLWIHSAIELHTVRPIVGRTKGPKRNPGGRQLKTRPSTQGEKGRTKHKNGQFKQLSCYQKLHQTGTTRGIAVGIIRSHLAEGDDIILQKSRGNGPPKTNGANQTTPY